MEEDKADRPLRDHPANKAFREMIQQDREGFGTLCAHHQPMAGAERIALEGRLRRNKRFLLWLVTAGGLCWGLGKLLGGGG